MRTSAQLQHPDSTQNHDARSLLSSQRLTAHPVQRIATAQAGAIKAGWAAGTSLVPGHDFSRISVGVIQTKLAVNPPGDAFEQEADRISQSVMRMPEPRVSRACACGGSCPGCRDQGDKDERVHPLW